MKKGRECFLVLPTALRGHPRATCNARRANSYCRRNGTPNEKTSKLDDDSVGNDWLREQINSCLDVRTWRLRNDIKSFSHEFTASRT